jgi:thiol-disulfide isomerase/thioredoxin
MAAEGNKIELGSNIVEFNLLNPKTKQFTALNEIKSNKGNVIIIMCNHCPYVIHIMPKLVEISNKFMQLGINFIGVNSNDIEAYPEDSPENMIDFIEKFNIQFPYLFDETQEIAKNYDAACTPDFYVYNQNDMLVYHGRFDSSRPKNNDEITGIDLIDVLEAILYGSDITKQQYPSIGCSIKWKDS